MEAGLGFPSPAVGLISVIKAYYFNFTLSLPDDDGVFFAVQSYNTPAIQFDLLVFELGKYKLQVSG
jgi:hypothetical protein